MIRRSNSIGIISAIIVLSSASIHASTARIKMYENINYEDHEIVLDEAGKIGLIVGAVALATYGLVKLGSWLFNKSDETATDQAQQSIREASAQYTNITTILGNAYAGYTDRQACINTISEPILYEIATAKYHDADIALYLKRFASTLKKINKHAKSLHERIHAAQFQSDQTYEALRIIARMKAIENQIQAALPALTFAYDYLKHHESYFTLFEAEDNMMYRYERDLYAVDSYHGDMTYMREMIHQSVMLYQRRHHDPYPYRWYLKRLEDDIHVMHAAMNNVAYDYTNRFNVANTLCNKLEFIRETLIGSPYYADELRAYEYAKIAQAAINEQQEQARAQQEQAYQLQRQNDLYAQELLQATGHL